MQYELEVQDHRYRVGVHRDDRGFTVNVDGRTRSVDVMRIDPTALSLLVDGRSYDVVITPALAGVLEVRVGGVLVAVTMDGRRYRRHPGEEHDRGAGPQRLVAPMPGKIVRVAVASGDTVQPRQTLVVVEAMKMENELRASRGGVVRELHAREGASVEAGALLVVVQ